MYIDLSYEIFGLQSLFPFPFSSSYLKWQPKIIFSYMLLVILSKYLTNSNISECLIFSFSLLILNHLFFRCKKFSRRNKWHFKRLALNIYEWIFSHIMIIFFSFLTDVT